MSAPPRTARIACRSTSESGHFGFRGSAQKILTKIDGPQAAIEIWISLQFLSPHCRWTRSRDEPQHGDSECLTHVFVRDFPLNREPQTLSRVRSFIMDRQKLRVHRFPRELTGVSAFEPPCRCLPHTIGSGAFDHANVECDRSAFRFLESVVYVGKLGAPSRQGASVNAARCGCVPDRHARRDGINDRRDPILGELRWSSESFRGGRVSHRSTVARRGWCPRDKTPSDRHLCVRAWTKLAPPVLRLGWPRS
jgi:hypothetical protein